MKYNIHLDGETQGPFTGAELKAKNLPPDTPCAAESDLSWGKLEEVLSAPTPHLRLEGSAMGTLVGGVLMALWLGSILTGSGLAKLLLVIGCLGVLALGVLAIVRIRNAEENTGLALAATGMTLAGAALVTGLLVNRGDGNGGRAGSSSAAKKKSSKTGGEDLLGLGKARRKANRMKCANNLGQISKTFIGFADENKARLPWQLTPQMQQVYFGRNFTTDPGTIFALDRIKDGLGTALVLVSPCDPDRKGSNEDAQINWHAYGPGNPIPCEAISYILVEGADVGRPGTVLATTRNLEGDIASRWVGADRDPGLENTMAGLNAGEGQAVTSDGSARQAADADLLVEGGELTGRHVLETGGVTRGQSSLRVFRCGG